MDNFIRGDFRLSVENHYCSAYIVNYAKPRYPALDIAYLAVQKQWRGRGVGNLLIDTIAQQARNQSFAGCQFLTVEALATSEYSAVGFIRWYVRTL